MKILEDIQTTGSEEQVENLFQLLQDEEVQQEFETNIDPEIRNEVYEVANSIYNCREMAQQREDTPENIQNIEEELKQLNEDERAKIE